MIGMKNIMKYRNVDIENIKKLRDESKDVDMIISLLQSLPKEIELLNKIIEGKDPMWERIAELEDLK